LYRSTHRTSRLNLVPRVLFRFRRATPPRGHRQTDRAGDREVVQLCAKRCGQALHRHWFTIVCRSKQRTWTSHARRAPPRARTRLAIRRAPRGMDQGQLESSSEEGSSLDEPSWVSWFCMLRNHEFFCEVDPAFVQDRFNLYGLKEVVGPLYGEAMTMILGYAPTGARRRAAWLTGRDERTQLHSL